MKKKPSKKKKVTELPTEKAIEQLLPKEIVDELRAAASDDDEENDSTKK